MRTTKRITKKQDLAVTASSTPVTRLAIGVEGGFQLDPSGTPANISTESAYSLVELPTWHEYPLVVDGLPSGPTTSVTGKVHVALAPSAGTPPSLPEGLLRCVEAVIVRQASNLADLAQVSAWEGDTRVVTKHASLQQLPNGKRISASSSDWMCEAANCGLRTNLWLNLSDGSVLCGRKQHGGYPGNGHALDHFYQTHFPLVVKLGSITPHAADVYSYDEDEMVIDPNLAQHLSHFGIDIMKMVKTEKSMLELEIEYQNRADEFLRILESSTELEPLYGPFCCGLINLGSSCYMNSILQLVFAIPDFVDRYAKAADANFDRVWNSRIEPEKDFSVQMSKLGQALCSGEFSKPPAPNQKETLPNGDTVEMIRPEGIKPQAFRSLIGAGHVEFSTKRQQDSHEFLLHLFNFVTRELAANGGQLNPLDALRFQVEERLYLPSGTGGGAGRRVQRIYRPDTVLSLNVPLEAATNRSELAAYDAKRLEDEMAQKKSNPGEKVIARVPFHACLESFLTEEVLVDFQASGTPKGQASSVKKITRLSTFPDFLIIQLKRFTYSHDWKPIKIEALVDVPFEFDFACLRTPPLAPNEQLAEDDAGATAAGSNSTSHGPQIDPSLIHSMIEMFGVSPNAARKAFARGGASLEEASNWLLEHLNDPDLEVENPAPVSRPAAGSGASQPAVSAENIEMLMGMGIPDNYAKFSLQQTNNDPTRALDWYFNRTPQEIDALLSGAQQAPSAAAGSVNFRDNGNTKYRLVGMVSHMGSTCNSGHYVTHLLRELHAQAFARSSASICSGTREAWVLYNDEKVARSESPPVELAYLYLFHRL